MPQSHIHSTELVQTMLCYKSMLCVLNIQDLVLKHYLHMPQMLLYKIHHIYTAFEKLYFFMKTHILLPEHTPYQPDSQCVPV